MTELTFQIGQRLQQTGTVIDDHGDTGTMTVNFYQMLEDCIETANIPAPRQSVVLWQAGPAQASLVRRSDDNLILTFSIGPRTIISKAMAHFTRNYSRISGGGKWKTRCGSEANYGEWVTNAKIVVAAVQS